LLLGHGGGALGFYDRIGYTRLEVEDPGPVIYLGRVW
jgi:hypothetical protein